MPDSVKLTGWIKARRLIALRSMRAAGQTDSTVAAFAKRDWVIAIGLICSSNSLNSSRHFIDPLPPKKKSSFYLKLSWQMLPLTFPMVVSRNSSTLLTCRVSWKGKLHKLKYVKSIICFHMLKKLSMKEERETFWKLFYTGDSWSRKLSRVMRSNKQWLFSLDTGEGKKIPLAFGERIHHLMIDFLFTFFFQGKIMAFVIFTVLISGRPISEVAVVLMAQLGQDAAFAPLTALPLATPLLRKTLLIDAQHYCLYSRAEFTILALL